MEKGQKLQLQDQDKHNYLYFAFTFSLIPVGMCEKSSANSWQVCPCRTHMTQMGWLFVSFIFTEVEAKAATYFIVELIIPRPKETPSALPVTDRYLIHQEREGILAEKLNVT